MEVFVEKAGFLFKNYLLRHVT